MTAKPRQRRWLLPAMGKGDWNAKLLRQVKHGDHLWCGGLRLEVRALTIMGDELTITLRPVVEPTRPKGGR